MKSGFIGKLFTLASNWLALGWGGVGGSLSRVSKAPNVKSIRNTWLIQGALTPMPDSPEDSNQAMVEPQHWPGNWGTLGKCWMDEELRWTRHSASHLGTWQWIGKQDPSSHGFYFQWARLTTNQQKTK